MNSEDFNVSTGLNVITLDIMDLNAVEVELVDGIIRTAIAVVLVVEVWEQRENSVNNMQCVMVSLPTMRQFAMGMDNA
jgi:hypothetical protein